MFSYEYCIGAVDKPFPLFERVASAGCKNLRHRGLNAALNIIPMLSAGSVSRSPMTANRALGMVFLASTLANLSLAQEGNFIFSDRTVGSASQFLPSPSSQPGETAFINGNAKWGEGVPRIDTGTRRRNPEPDSLFGACRALR